MLSNDLGSVGQSVSVPVNPTQSALFRHVLVEILVEKTASYSAKTLLEHRRYSLAAQSDIRLDPFSR